MVINERAIAATLAEGRTALRRQRAGSTIEVRPETIGLLVSDCAAGNVLSFERLYDLTATRVYGVILGVVRDPARSEEVAQEVFLEIWRLAHRCDETGSPMGWIVSMAHRRAVDCVRTEVSRRARDDRFTSEVDVVARDDPGDVVVSRATRDRVNEVVDSLPGSQATLIRLAFHDGLSHVEIADVTGLPLGTVKTRIRAGLRSLARKLADHTSG